MADQIYNASLIEALWEKICENSPRIIGQFPYGRRAASNQINKAQR
jgi:hypothetical protein